MMRMPFLSFQLEIVAPVMSTYVGSRQKTRMIKNYIARYPIIPSPGTSARADLRFPH